VRDRVGERKKRRKASGAQQRFSLSLHLEKLLFLGLQKNSPPDSQRAAAGKPKAIPLTRKML
jgi:hypothetical protein